MASTVPPPAAVASGSSRTPLQTAPVSAPASSSTPTQNAGPHLLSLKVMRASAPSLAISEKPFYDPASHSSNDLLTAISLGIDDADSHDLLSNRLTSSSTTPADHFPISNLLTLPNSFGTLFLGETFRTYLCVRNESSTAVREPSLRVEMQVGASEEAGRWHQLAHVILPTPTRYSPNPEEDEEYQGTPRWELDPGSALETSLGYDIKDLGPHVLVCTVGYKSPHTQSDGQVTWVERSFRKFYKFSVDRSPISVRTKVHQPRYASSLHHPDGKVRDRVELEVQVQNVGGSGAGLVLNGLTLKPAPGWEWESLDRPEGGEAMWIQSGSNEILADGDVRQYLFRLMPEKEVALTEEVLKGGIDLGRSAEGLVMRGDALGHLDISWRMALGEPGRLQTSQLVRRRVVSPPVVVDLGTASQGTSSLNPRLKTRLTLQPRTLEKLREVNQGDLVDLDLDVAVCDVSGLLLPPLQKGPSKETVQKTPELQQQQDDDDDDDTPLSEIASSPRAVIKRNPMDSTTSSAVHTQQSTSSPSTEAVVIRRTLHLALQHCSLDPPLPPPTTSQSDPFSTSTNTVAADHPSTPRKTPVPSRTSTPTQSSAGVSALNKARLQANLSSLVRNSSLSSLRPRASVDEEAGGKQSSSTPPALPPKSSDGANENLTVQVSTEKTQPDIVPERKVLPTPRISNTTLTRLYRAYLETHSQALNRPASTTIIPTTFLPTPTTTPLGSTLLPLPPITFDISVLSSGSALFRSDRPISGETRLPVTLRYALDEPGDDGVVRFGGVRVLLLSYSDVLVKDGDGVEREAEEVRECMTVIDEVPVIAEAVVVAR